ncbi:LysR substrate-binding domain-containing protein [Novispirillum sp. DQ9]|uniref:LysR substrate-binding domain-containing protein n=1 Tax=Novispirillum sp. DQ9 TaxID=3398612 RepID=UPI003C7AB267
MPPLNALRAFEAAARLGSFVGAAEELSVTPAAISHQVKGLEEALGVTLFTRSHRAVSLTREGRRLLPGLSDGFSQLEAAVAAVRPAVRGGPVVVSCGPSFAAKWLVPRLETFLARHPDITVRVEAEARLVDLVAEEVNLAVRLSASNPGPGLIAEPLFGERLFPVCAPRLRVGLRRASELALQTLIYDDLFEAVPNAGHWADWLRVAGIAGLTPRRTIHYSFTTLALDSAIRGQGVAMGRSSLVCADLQAGTLVRPFDVTVPSGLSYCVVRAADQPEHPGAAALRAWLAEEAEAFRKQWPDLVI